MSFLRILVLQVIIILSITISGCVKRLPEIKPDAQHPGVPAVSNKDSLYSDILIAQHHKYSGNIEQSIRAFEQMMILYPNEPDVPYSYAKLLIEIALRLRSQEQATQLKKQAMELLEQKCKLFPEHVPMRSLLIDLYYFFERDKDALTNLTDVVKMNPNDLESTFKLARLQTEQGFTNDALNLLKSAPDSVKNAPDYPKVLALATAQSSDFEKAAQLYESYLQAFPADYEARFNYGLVLEDLRQTEKAFAVFTELLNDHPKSNEIRIQIAELLRQQNKIDDAISILNESVKIEPENLTVLFNIAKLYLLKGDFKTAEAKFEQLLQDNPDNQLILYYLAATRYESGRWEDAIATIQPILEKEHIPYEILEMAAQIYLEQDMGSHAVRYIEKSIRENPSICDNYVLLGSILSDMHESKKALAAYKRGLKYCSEQISYIVRLCVFYESQGQWKKAIKIAEKLRQIHPQEPDLNNFIGYTLADNGIELERAYELIKRAVDSRPNVGAYIDSLGWVLFRMGQLDSALEYLSEAMKLDDSDPLILDHIAQVLMQLGRIDEAIAAYQKASEMDKKYLDRVHELTEMKKNTSKTGVSSELINEDK